MASCRLLDPQDGLGLQGQSGSRREGTERNSPRCPSRQPESCRARQPHLYPEGQARAEAGCPQGLLGTEEGGGRRLPVEALPSFWAGRGLWGALKAQGRGSDLWDLQTMACSGMDMGVRD